VIAPTLFKHFSPHSSHNSTSFLSVHDAFLVKYHHADSGHPPSNPLQDEGQDEVEVVCESCQRYLPLHSDESTLSIVIPLNDQFQGGGTYFVDLKRAVQPGKGHLLSFKGDLLHGGDPLLSGTRYIIAAFFMFSSIAVDSRPKQKLESQCLLSKSTFSFQFDIQ
jgi:hypothetical protein